MKYTFKTPKNKNYRLNRRYGCKNIKNSPLIIISYNLLILDMLSLIKIMSTVMWFYKSFIGNFIKHNWVNVGYELEEGEKNAVPL
jgi:hypothetical protein